MSISGTKDYPGLGIACCTAVGADIDVYEPELADRIEALGEGCQFVSHDVHPNTRKPYAWDDEIPETRP